MRNRKYTLSKNIKFVRIDNSIWIEADTATPDEVARIEFLQKMHLIKVESNPFSRITEK